MSARALKAVPRKSAPPLLVADEARAARVYPDPTLAAKWLASVQWMQKRPGGSVWVLDTNRPAPKWRSHSEEIYA